MVGVIVPVHGFAPYLAEALDCVLGQRPAPDAVVVVDDASPEPIALHPDHARRCTLLRRERCGGPAAARATGLAALDAGGRRSSRCATPTTPGPTASSPRSSPRSRSIPEAALCFGRALVVGADGRPTGERWARARRGPARGPAAAGAALRGEPDPDVERRPAPRRARARRAASSRPSGSPRTGTSGCASPRAARRSSARRRRSCATAATPAA